MKYTILEQFKLNGKSALIFGGNRGLGLAMANALADAGANVAIAARDTETNKKSAEAIRNAYHVDCIGLTCDVTSEEQIASTVQQTADQFGKIDILINSAGINIRGRIEELSFADFQKVQQVNVNGAWIACREVVPHMKKNGYGRIINVGSMLSLTAIPERTPYATSKGAILIAGELLSAFNEGKGIMLGGIAGVQPTEVVVLGAGTVGEFATRAALGLGASVKVFDNSLSRLRRLQNDLGARIYTSVLQPKVLAKSIMRADVVIGAIRSPLGRTPCVVSEDMVSNMKEGSVIVDVSIDQGGCFETSKVTNHNNPTYVKHGIVHYCVPNIASRVPRTASFAISNIFSPLLIAMADNGGCLDLIRNDHGFRSGVYIYRGILVSEILGQVFDLKYKDIDLLMMGLKG